MPRVVDGCIKCGACLRECPVLRWEGADRFPGPRRLVVEGPRFNPELETLRGPLPLCTTCGRCEAACPGRLPLTEAVVGLRALLNRAEERPEGQRRMLENVDRTSRTVRPDGPTMELPTEGDVLYFPGCIALGRSPEGVRSAMALLEAAGARPYVPEGWACCGSPLEKIGEVGRLEKVRAINEMVLGGAGEVVASCPGCTVQLRRGYGKEAMHVLEYLDRQGGIPTASYGPHAPAVRVALHRPCHLARVVGPHTMEMAEDLLASVPGVELIAYDGEEECCGGGGGAASADPPAALRMAVRKVASAKRAGADLLLAPCPFCVVNLRRAGGLAVQDLTTFLSGRLRPRP